METNSPFDLPNLKKGKHLKMPEKILIVPNGNFFPLYCIVVRVSQIRVDYSSEKKIRGVVALNNPYFKIHTPYNTPRNLWVN